MYNIRKATTNDFESIRNIMLTVYDVLEDKAWYYIEDDVKELWLKTQIAHSGFALVAEDDENNNEIAGFLIVRFPWNENDNLGIGYYETTDELLKVAHMEDSAVLPDHRGNQLMCRFLYEAEKLLGSNYTHLMATVHPNNYASLNSLVKCGFQILQKQDHKYGENMPRLIMLKEINDK
jgi:ribosomal protein S18 acetylase RimI-like enzyme